MKTIFESIWCWFEINLGTFKPFRPPIIHGVGESSDPKIVGLRKDKTIPSSGDAKPCCEGAKAKPFSYSMKAIDGLLCFSAKMIKREKNSSFIDS